MNHPAQNWTNLINECTSIDTAWHGVWTAADPDSAFVLFCTGVLQAVGAVVG